MTKFIEKPTAITPNRELQSDEYFDEGGEYSWSDYGRRNDCSDGDIHFKAGSEHEGGICDEPSEYA